MIGRGGGDRKSTAHEIITRIFINVMYTCCLIWGDCT